MPTFEYIVSGEVQGVGYRYFAVRAAARLGVTGWVKNMRTGQVQIVASGPDSLLDEFERLLREGPRMSRVTGVQRVPSPQEEFDGFGVRY